MKTECGKITKFVYLQCYTTASVNRGLLLMLLLLFCIVEEKFNRIKICLKKIKKKMVHRKPSLCFQDSEGPRHSLV